MIQIFPFDSDSILSQLIMIYFMYVIMSILFTCERNSLSANTINYTRQCFIKSTDFLGTFVLASQVAINVSDLLKKKKKEPAHKSNLSVNFDYIDYIDQHI